MVMRILSIPFDELIEEELKAMRLVEEGKTKAEKIISEARKKAQTLIDKATKTENIQAMIAEEEKKTKKEAKKILDNYQKESLKFHEIPEKSFSKAVELSVNEVLHIE
jgi:vacuolar-type H+-ATPase subunit H